MIAPAAVRGRRSRAPIAAVLVLMSAVTSIADAGAPEPTPTAFRELQLGYLALDAGDPEAALRHYAAALELARGDQQRFNALLGLGSAALELDRPDEARIALEEAHRLKPGESGATFTLGVACRRQGDLERAVAYLAEAAARAPEMTEALVELAIAYGALGRHADAADACREALVRQPDDVDARLGLAVALYHLDDNEQSVAEFRKVLEVEPDHLRAHFGLGLALFYAGDRDGAIEQVAYLNRHAPELAADLHRWIFSDD